MWLRFHVASSLLFLLVAILGFLAIITKSPKHRLLLLNVVLGTCCALTATERLPPKLTFDGATLPVRCHGRVTAITYRSAARATYTVSGTVDPSPTAPIRHVGLQLTVHGIDPHLPLPTLGQQVVVFGKGRLPYNNALPGGFNERSYFGGNGISWLVTASHRNVGIIGPALWFADIIGHLRTLVSTFVGHRFPSDVAPIVLALLTGDRSQIPAADKAAFNRAGTAHMFCVSGMHVGIVASLLMMLTTWLRPLVRYSLVICVVWCFVILTGAQPPALRAGIMTTVVFLAFLAERGPDALNMLACAVLVIVCTDPTALWSASMHLSVGACLGLILLLPRLRNLCSTSKVFSSGVVRSVALSLAVSFAAGAGTAIPMASTVGSLSLLSPLANLVVVPLLSGALMFGIAVFAFDPVLPFAADALVEIVSQCVRISVASSHVMSWIEPELADTVVYIGWLVALGSFWVSFSSTLRVLCVRCIVYMAVLVLVAMIPAGKVPAVQILDRRTVRAVVHGESQGAFVMLSDRYPGTTDGALVTYLAALPGTLVVSCRGKQSSLVVDRIEERRPVVRLQYLAERWNTLRMHPIITLISARTSLRK